MATRDERHLERVIRDAGEAVEARYREAVALTLAGASAQAAKAWEEVERVLGVALAAGNLGGQASIMRQYMGLGGKLTQVSSVGFRPGVMPEAVEAIVNRVPVLADDVAEVLQEGRAIAAKIMAEERGAVLGELAERSVAIRESLRNQFWVSDVDLETTINLREMVADVIRGSADPDEFVVLPDFIDRAQLQGARDLSRARLETVYRVNVSKAYSEGQIERMGSSEVRSLIPLMALHNPKDSRSRPAHAGVDGYVNTIENFRTQGIVTPAGFNCRCVMRGVSFVEAVDMGWVSENGVIDYEALRRHNGVRQTIIDRGEYPDPGWVGS